MKCIPYRLDNGKGNFKSRQKKSSQISNVKGKRTPKQRQKNNCKEKLDS